MSGTRAAPHGDGLVTESNHLDQLVSRIAIGDRAAFRLLYAFMAIRVWRAANETPLDAASAIAVSRSTFVEVWHLARAATGVDARAWLDGLSARRINDRLRISRPDDGRGRRSDQPVAADDRGLAPFVAEYDDHVDRELAALLGDDPATVRFGSSAFVRTGDLDDLDRTLATIAALPGSAAVGPRASGTRPPSTPPSTGQR
jgi:RNA polymerase sigma-70 factor (ECF subfamily)